MVHRQLGTLPRPGWADWIGWAIGKHRRYIVSGDSMAPVLREGDWVFGIPAGSGHEPVPAGDIVVARHPFILDKLLIKRVQSITENGLFLVGDNPGSSTDSRTLGPIPWSHLVAKVTTVWPAKH